jgi:hypothetical protein
MIAGRYLSIGSLAVMSVLGAGFAAWSGFTGPEVAGAQLEAASANTAATSFVEITDSTESVIGTVEVITTEDMNTSDPPDRIRLIRTGRVTGVDQDYSYRLTLTQIGNACWTTVEGPARLPAIQCEALRVRAEPLMHALTGSDVTDRDGIYSLSSASCERFISPLVGAPVGMCSFEATIGGSFLSWQRLSFITSVRGESVIVVQNTRLSHFGDVSPITTPPGPPTATVKPAAAA